MKTIFASLLFMFSICQVLHAQDKKPYEEKFVQANGVNLHYLDLGGSGLPIIFLQDFHDDAREWVDFTFPGFAPRFAKTNRVFAITRRGWGRSSDPGWGFDVATQAEDVIAFMDALQIQKAVLVGRVPACGDMTFIAEHHPQRVAGLVYWNRPHVPHVAKDSLLWEYGQMMVRMACDVPTHKSIPRNSWQPHFLNAKPGSIAVPAMYFSYGEEMDNQSIENRFFEVGLMMAKQDSSMLCDTIARNYFVSLSKNEELQNSIRKALQEADRSVTVTEAFKKAFTPALRKVNLELPLPDDFTKYWKEKGSDFFLKHISEFITTIKK